MGATSLALSRYCALVVVLSHADHGHVIESCKVIGAGIERPTEPALRRLIVCLIGCHQSQIVSSLDVVSIELEGLPRNPLSVGKLSHMPVCSAQQHITLRIGRLQRDHSFILFDGPREQFLRGKSLSEQQMWLDFSGSIRMQSSKTSVASSTKPS